MSAETQTGQLAEGDSEVSNEASEVVLNSIWNLCQIRAHLPLSSESNGVAATFDMQTYQKMSAEGFD